MCPIVASSPGRFFQLLNVRGRGKKRPGDEASPIGAYIQLKSGFLTIIQSLESLPNIKIGNFRTLILRMLRGVGRRSKVRGRNRRCLLP